MKQVTEYDKPLVQAENLKKYFYGKKHWNRQRETVKALDGVSLEIARGEVLGVVGESGCGKSTLGRVMLRLTEATGGDIFYDGESIRHYGKEQMRQMRKKMRMIFQDPYASLNPRMTVHEIIRAPLDAFRIGTMAEREDKVRAMMEEVSLGPHTFNRYPHEFSGGQRQRIVIARALVSEPEFVVCDEPVSALDVSVRSQVLNLMSDLKQKKNLTYLFISHDLSVVYHICDRIAVMYLGRVVEIAEREELFAHPLHPYTQALLSAIPVPDVDHQPERILLSGEVPSPLDPPSGCLFHPRCGWATARCREEMPIRREAGCGHWVACHLCKDP